VHLLPDLVWSQILFENVSDFEARIRLDLSDDIQRERATFSRHLRFLV
jgi:hypothetical protein